MFSILTTLVGVVLIAILSPQKEADPSGVEEESGSVFMVMLYGILASVG